MHIFYWILVAWFILGALITPYSIGKPRGPLTKSQAVVSLVISVLVIFALSTAAWR